MNYFMVDFAFKLIFSNQFDQNSLYLLRLLIEKTTGRKLHDFMITNPENFKSCIEDKTVRFDINLIDMFSNRFEVEMQTNKLSNVLAKRFGYYGAVLVQSGLLAGEDYSLLRQNIQIILINDVDHTNPCLKACYESRTIEGIREGKKMKDSNVLLLRYYIYLPYINKIAKEKGLGHLSDYEMMIYILYNGINEKVKKEKKRKVIDIMETKLNEIMMSEVLRKQILERRIALMCDKEEKEEFRMMGYNEGKSIGYNEGKTIGYDEGKSIGYNEGKSKGYDEGKTIGYDEGALYKEIEIVLEMTKCVYPKESLEWIKGCNSSQLKFIRKLLFENLSYEDFCKKVRRI